MHRQMSNLGNEMLWEDPAAKEDPNLMASPCLRHQRFVLRVGGPGVLAHAAHQLIQEKGVTIRHPAMFHVKHLVSIRGRASFYIAFLAGQTYNPISPTAANGGCNEL
jgi:hypothetical protein